MAQPPKDRPILFSAAMMRAILSGEKTQTRRLATSPLAKLVPGDRLYTREAYRMASFLDHVRPTNLSRNLRISYEASPLRQYRYAKLRPGIHMPKWMSRATLTVTDVKFECVQDISEYDALEEGVMEFKRTCPELTSFTTDPVRLFEILWDTLHGDKPGESWADNPKIVASAFTMTPVNIEKLTLVEA